MSTKRRSFEKGHKRKYLVIIDGPDVEDQVASRLDVGRHVIGRGREVVAIVGAGAIPILPASDGEDLAAHARAPFAEDRVSRDPARARGLDLAPPAPSRDRAHGRAHHVLLAPSSTSLGRKTARTALLTPGKRSEP